MLIEVAGVHGAGKSSLVELLRREINEDAAPGWAYERRLQPRGRRLLESIALAQGLLRAEERFPLASVELAHVLELVGEAATHLGQARGDRHIDYFVCSYRRTWLAEAAWRGVGGLDLLCEIAARAPDPDLTIRLDVPAEVALARLHERKKGDSLLALQDPQAAIERLVSCYADLATPSDIELDGTLGLALLVAQTRSAIENVRGRLTSDGCQAGSHAKCK